MTHFTYKDAVFVKAESADYESIATIYNEHILAGKSTMEEQVYSAKMIGEWVKKFSEREELWVLKREAACIGWGIIKKYSPREGYRFAAETAVYLKGEETRKGYGSFIKRALIERCKGLHYHHLVAKIFAVNTASIAYNEQLGYEIVGRQKEIGFKNGQWTDIVIMQLILTD